MWGSRRKGNGASEAREFSRMDTLFGCREDGCQTLFLILKHRRGLQHPGGTHGEQRRGGSLPPLYSEPAWYLCGLRHG